MEEAGEAVDPVFIFFWRVGRVVGLRSSSGEAIGAVQNTRNVDEAELESEDGDNPPVDGGAGRLVGMIEHAFDVSSVDLDDEMSKTDEEPRAGSEGAEQAVDFELRLRVGSLTVVEDD